MNNSVYGHDGHCRTSSDKQSSSSSANCLFSCLEIYTHQAAFSTLPKESVSSMIPFSPCFLSSLQSNLDIPSKPIYHRLSSYEPEVSAQRVGTIRKNE